MRDIDNDLHQPESALDRDFLGAPLKPRLKGTIWTIVATATLSGAELLLRAHAGIFEDAQGAAAIEDTAGTKALKRGSRILGGPPTFLYKIDHLLGEGMGNHAVAAHGRKQDGMLVWNVIADSFKAKRIAETMPRHSGELTARLGIFQ